ncbi:MAG: 16S rRNA (guanine(966)-N(2))-methyltransferase RsmD [Lachnospiraceae bacterium]|nr:16S rRNA (guanine(966)-N(2))-methyltransferase RsmD [Lachnospiraceae bacterium]
MRVISGSAKRLPLVTPKGLNTRPTSDKVKETLFNILAPELYDANFLDLFAGSGAIGIEALSRGSRHCTFIEKDREAVKCIRQNLEKTHLSEMATVYASDVLTSLHHIGTGPFDIVFMDPPYKEHLEEKVLSMLSQSDMIDDSSLIITEAAADTDLAFAYDLGFEITRVKEYKNSKHVFLRKRPGKETL